MVKLSKQESALRDAYTSRAAKMLLRLVRPSALSLGDTILFSYWVDTPTLSKAVYRTGVIVGMTRFGKSYILNLEYRTPGIDGPVKHNTRVVIYPTQYAALYLGCPANAMPLQPETNPPARPHL